ncbi:MAG TPA: amidohydrolase family protein [Bacteroidota bacterium]|nr:amidohydrolase family protein [Bacteroidota bacterium]
MRRIPRQAAGMFALAFVALAAQPQRAQCTGSDTLLVEEGEYILHKFEQPIGEETFRTVRLSDTLTTGIRFKFTDRGGQVPLQATFRSAPDLTPLAFAIKGRTSRSSKIDDSVGIEGGRSRIREWSRWSEAATPDKFFTIAGYAPVTMQMLMVRYWSTHGMPPDLHTFPEARVKIEPRGYDTISAGGKEVPLHRFTVEGLIWGRETLWFDPDLNLIAAVSTDAEFDHFEAVQKGYEGSLGTFVGRAGTDGMAALAELSRGISGSRAPTIALVGGTMIDMTGRPPVPDAAILIENGRIAAAGPRSTLKIPPSATIVDTKGKTVLPGLWDMHAHVEQVEWGPIYLAAGVTTVRDCGNEFEFITSVRDAIARGRGLGPRILAAGIVDGSGPYALGVQRVDSLEEARMWVQRYHRAGFQQMKIYSSVKLPNLKAVTEEAHRLGMTVTGHVPIGLSAYQAVEAGQDQINHMSNVMEILIPPLPPGSTGYDRFVAMANVDTNSPYVLKAIVFFKSHHTVIDPTLALAEFSTATTAKPLQSFEPGVTRVAPELAAQLVEADSPSQKSVLLEKMFRKELVILGAMHRAGIPIVAGTDQTVPGHSLHREIEIYVMAGFTPFEALEAATVIPARVMGVEKELGTIEPGKRADLIIVNGNPLEDIHNSRNVEYVITNGTMYSTPELWKSAGFKPWP